MSVLALVVFFDILGSSLVETLWGHRKDAVGVKTRAVNPKLAAFQLTTNVFPISRFVHFIFMAQVEKNTHS